MCTKMMGTGVQRTRHKRPSVVARGRARALQETRPKAAQNSRTSTPCDAAEVKGQPPPLRSLDVTGYQGGNIWAGWISGLSQQRLAPSPIIEVGLPGPLHRGYS